MLSNFKIQFLSIETLFENVIAEYCFRGNISSTCQNSKLHSNAFKSMLLLIIKARRYCAKRINIDIYLMKKSYNERGERGGERFNYQRRLNKPVEFQNNRTNFQYLKLSNIKPLFLCPNIIAFVFA